MLYEVCPKSEVTHNRWEILPHPPYSPDLAPSDCHVFGRLKEHISGRHVASDEEVHCEVRSRLMVLNKNYFSSGIGK
jgi:transposase